MGGEARLNVCGEGLVHIPSVKEEGLRKGEKNKEITGVSHPRLSPRAEPGSTTPDVGSPT